MINRNKNVYFSPSTLLLSWLMLLSLVDRRATTAAGDKSITLDSTEISYVMEPFEARDPEWFQYPLSLSEVNITIDSNEYLFGSSSVRVEYQQTEAQQTNSNELFEFGWILADRPHSCFGAYQMSLWYKVPNTIGMTGMERLKLTLYDDSACNANMNCENLSTNMEEYVLIDHPLIAGPNSNNDWQELRAPFPPDMDLSRIRGFKIAVSRRKASENDGDSGAHVEEDDMMFDFMVNGTVDVDEPMGQGDDIINSENTMTLFLDQLACVGGGDLLGSAFHIQHSFQDSVNDGTWSETYYQSDASAGSSILSLNQEGELSFDYVVEQVEAWGGFLDVAHLAKGAAYYNLTQATDITLDFQVSNAASIPGRAIFRLVLQDNSDCSDDCDSFYHSHERYYSFHSILDQTTDSGQLRIPLIGSTSPETPFWLTGWSGITGNTQLDISQIKGYTLEVVLDSQSDQGTLVSGSLLLSNFVAVQSVPEPEVFYVVEPFESISPHWYTESSQLFVNMTTPNNNDASLFGDSSLKIDYSFPENNDSQQQVVEFGWILSDRPHNCFGADYFSLWYKYDVLGDSLDAIDSTETSIRLSMYVDINCILTPGMACDDRTNLVEYIIGHVPSLRYNNGWNEITMNSNLDLRRLRGWKIDVVATGAPAGSSETIPLSASLSLDQLSCAGDGSLFGAPFHIGNIPFATAVAEGTWSETYFQSEVSRSNTFRTLQDGKLNINYSVQQVENWGGFLDFAFLSPANSYYNISKATDISFDYMIQQPASIPGRAIFRLVLQDNSDCVEDCDSFYHTHERYYSFHSILDFTQDDADRQGRVEVPLVASRSPDTPFWLTGWSGIIGNAELNTDNLKGYTLEFVLDSQSEVGTVVSGSAVLSNLDAIITADDPNVERPDDNDDNDNIDGGGGEVVTPEDDAKCVEETDLHIFESSSIFTRIEFLGSRCCDLCTNDPSCLYALSSGRDCYIASTLDSESVGLLNTDIERMTLTAFWMDDAVKRGDFCNLCTCRESDKTIDCRGRNLLIVPKTLKSVPWKPVKLDLRDNPNLIILGSGSLQAIRSSLEELYLPRTLFYLGNEALRGLPNLKTVSFEGASGNDVLVGQSKIGNVITSPHEAFGDICCARGLTVHVTSPANGLTYCDMNVRSPGSDSIFEPFNEYIGAKPLLHITPSSPFLSEAAESVEKCAEYCSISSGCNYFSYDARLPNAEHECQLLEDNGTHRERVCCDADHYADVEQTTPGRTTGLPPRTRHVALDARASVSPQSLVAAAFNSFQTTYQVKLGAHPLLGAVWVEPKLTSGNQGLNITITPSKIALYEANTTADVTVKVDGIVPKSTAEIVTLIITNLVDACDSAFIGSDGNNVNIDVVIPAKKQPSSNSNLAYLIPIFAVVVLGLIAFLIYERRRKKNDTVWKVKKEELHFGDPPQIIGRGTFGLVLLAEYRGTQVAVKRAIPPRSRRKDKNVFNSAFNVPAFLSSLPEGSISASNRSASDSGGNNTDRDLSEHDDIERGKQHSAGMGSWGGNGTRTASGSGSFAGFGSGLLSGGKGESKQAQLAQAFRTKTANDAATWNKLKQDFIEEMRHLSKLRHPCITTVMGAVISQNTDPMLVMEYMDHGSLYDLLHNETMFLEPELLLPLLRDISQGLRFLHAADPQVIHGDLKAANILVDNKFRAKVADFGLSQKRNVGATGTPFWMAPELLRGESTNSAASDIYSFGIILYEVYSRRDPYEGENVKEVLRLVADKAVNKRPPMPEHAPPPVRTLMEDCLVDDPDKRPTSEELDIRLKRIDVKNVEPDGMAKNSSISLFDIFPKHIAEALRDGRTVEPEHRDVVTIFFSDIVGFTTISSSLPPRKVANMLDRLYSKFDELSHSHDIFKVETIGDAYMAVTNLVKDQPHDHAKRIAQFAIDAIAAANETLIDLEDPDKGHVNIRVGFHSGAIVADVVGNRNPRYCLFGDAVNTASRMESNSKVNRIHCSDKSAEILRDQFPELPLLYRGCIEIKGKGDMDTYWVNEKGGGIGRKNSKPVEKKDMKAWVATGDTMDPVNEEAHVANLVDSIIHSNSGNNSGTDSTSST